MNIGAVETTNASLPVSSASSYLSGARQELAAAAQNAEANNEKMKEMVAEMQSHISSMNVSLKFSTYGAHNQKIAVTVINEETGEVVREIPAKEIQELHAKMSELAGMIFNRNV